MADGALVRSLEELREHFDLETALTSYITGKLLRWMQDYDYLDEVNSISMLDPDEANFAEELCCILGAQIDTADLEKTSIVEVRRKNEKRTKLKHYTADERALSSIDQTAMSQQELEELIRSDHQTLQLCGDFFSIPVEGLKKHYIGLGDPVVEVPGPLAGSHRGLQGFAIVLERGVTPREAMSSGAITADLVSRLRRIEERSPNVTIETFMGWLYEAGKAVDRSFKAAFEWYHKAAAQGYAPAQYMIGRCYEAGKGVETRPVEARDWYQKAAAQGYVPAQQQIVRRQEEEPASENTYAFSIDESRRLSGAQLECRQEEPRK